MSAISQASAKDFAKDLKRFDKDMTTIREHVGPAATVMAGNRVLRSALTLTVKAVHKEQPPEIKQFHIRNRIRVRNMSVGRPIGYMHAYVRDMPAIRLGYKKGSSRIEGMKVYRKHAKRGPSGKYRMRAKGGARSQLGGVKVGTKFIPNGFVNIATKSKFGSKGPTVQIFRRHQKETWASPGVRAPFSVVKYPLRKTFDKHFKASLQKSIKDNYDKEFDAAYKTGMAKLLVKK